MLTFTSTARARRRVDDDLVISLAGNDDPVEGPENYTVALTNPGSTTGSSVAGTGSVTTTITDNDTATWSLSGPRAWPRGPAPATRCTWPARCRRARRRQSIWLLHRNGPAPPAPTMRAS